MHLALHSLLVSAEKETPFQVQSHGGLRGLSHIGFFTTSESCNTFLKASTLVVSSQHEAEA